MKVNKKELKNSQVELEVEIPWEDLEKKLSRGAELLSQQVKIDGFRPGKAPFEVVKDKLGEIAIINEAAQIVLEESLPRAIKEAELAEHSLLGYPEINIIKLAPNNDFVYKATLTFLPEIKLGKYKDLGIKPRKIEADDKEIEKILKEWQEMRATEVIANREVCDGDKVIIDINMFQGKVPVEGGQSKDTAVIIGKDYIIAGFDKKLLGAKKGDERSFSLPYPEDFHLKNLAGKMVDFKVKIKDVYERQLPKIDDKFAVSFGFKSVLDLRKYLRDSILKHKKQEARQAIEKEIIESIIKNSSFGDLPESLVTAEVNEMINELRSHVESQGGKFDDYLKSIKKTREQLILELTPEAIKRLKAALILRELAQKEEIKISEEEIKAQIERMLAQARTPEEKEKINSPEFHNHLGNSLLSQRIVEKLYEWNVAKE